MSANTNGRTLPRRKSIRLQDFDYTEPNAYFVTICARNRTCLFGRIIDDAMHLNDFGRIASVLWEQIPAHFPHMVLDEWVVMPNHVHGIVFIAESNRGGNALPRGPGAVSRATHASPETDANMHRLTKTSASPQKGSIGAAVGSYKSAVTKHIGDVFGKSRETIWQRGFYDHVIRNRTALDRIRRYIAENPARWSRDPENPDRNRL